MVLFKYIQKEEAATDHIFSFYHLLMTISLK